MRIGDVIADRFELEKLAGTGGMGAVYRAKDRQTGLPIALKSLHDPGGRHAERFLREAQVLATLNHPNIVRYVAHGRTDKGELYMAMEWIEGQSLSQRIADAGGLSVADSLAVASQLASALAFAHARGIIHRDIKPSNVYVLDGTLVPKLLDFGIARLAQAARLTSNGMMLGTPGYMAPEQTRGAASVSARADVFSLGCLLFKCLTARPPFIGDDMRGLMAQVLFEPAPRVASLKPEIPAALDALVDRMLAKEASLRPADGAVVLAELRSIATGVPGADSPAFEVPEALGDGELQWICAVLARAPKPSAEMLKSTLPPEHARATEQLIPIARFPDPKRPAGTHLEMPRSASAFEIPQVAEGEVSPEIGTVVDSAGSAPQDLTDALRPYDAEVDQLADGSLLTTLGDDADPVALACRAVRCAQALVARQPQLRVVISTGRALRSDHPGVGPALDRAAAQLRNLVHGPPGVRMDITTAQLVRGRFAINVAVQPPSLDGDADPLAIPHSPLQGRERELGKLFDFAARSVTVGRVRWSLLVGAPGVGLTRVLREVRRGLAERTPRARVWAVGADPAETHTPFALVRRMLVAGGVEPERRRAFDTQSGSSTAPDLVGALVELLRRASQQQPLIILVDDLDRADPASLALLARSLPAEAPLPVALIGVGRPLVVKRLEPLGVSGELRELEPLPASAAAQIVHDRSHGKVEGDALEDVVRLANGNPWMVRALVEGGAVLTPGGFPEPALARTAVRLEAIGAEGRRVLRAVSVWEGDVSRGDLGALLGGAASDPAVDAQLEHLVRGGFLERRGDGGLWGEATYRLAEPIVAAATRASFIESDRVLAHRLAATRLEQRANPEAAQIAHHWEQAGQPSRAAEHYRRAAAASIAADDLESAARFADRGLRGATDAGLRVPLLSVAAEAHLGLGELGPAVDAAGAILSASAPSSSGWARAALQLAIAGGASHDASRLVTLADALLSLPVWAEASAACAAAMAANALSDLGDMPRAAALEKRLPARPEDGHDPLSTAARLLVDGARASRQGDLPRAYTTFRAAAQALTGADEVRLALHAHLRAASALGQGGVVEQGEPALRRVRAQAERDGLRLLQGPAALELGQVLQLEGKHEESDQRLAEALELGAVQRSPSLFGDAARVRAERHLAAGRLAEALEDAVEAEEQLARFPARRLRAQALIALVRAQQGELPAALTLLRAAIGQLDALGAEAGEVELAVRHAAAEVFFRAGLRDLGRQQLSRARDRIAALLRAWDPAWRQGLSRKPHVLRLAELAAEWLG